MLFLAALALHDRVFAVFDSHAGKQMLDRCRPRFIDGVADDANSIPYVEMMIYSQDNAISGDAYNKELTFFAAVPTRAAHTYKIVTSMSTFAREQGVSERLEYESFLAAQEWCACLNITLIL